MTWTHIKANYNTGVVEQWIKRVGNAPAVSLKCADRRALTWQAALLCTSGISTVPLEMRGSTLAEAQAECETALREMGWEWS